MNDAEGEQGAHDACESDRADSTADHRVREGGCVGGRTGGGGEVEGQDVEEGP